MALPVRVDPLALEGGAVEADPVVEVNIDPSDSEPLVPGPKAVGVADLDRETIAGLSRGAGFVAVGVMSSWKLGTGRAAGVRQTDVSL